MTAPNIPVQTLFKGCPARLDKTQVVQLVLIDIGDQVGIVFASCRKGQHITIFLVTDNGGDAAGVGGNNRQTESTGLPEDIGSAVSLCRQNEEVGRSKELLDLPPLALIVFVQERTDHHLRISLTGGEQKKPNDPLGPDAPLLSF